MRGAHRTHPQGELGDMPRKEEPPDPVLRKLEAIHATLQDTLILHAKAAGLTKSHARELVGVADARVGRIWKALGNADE